MNRYRPPDLSCNAHAHVFGPYVRFPLTGTRPFVPAETAFEDYRRMHEVLGFQRGVLTQPTHYGTDNACMLDALRRSGSAVKGIVALDAGQLTVSEIARLDALGVRGVRIGEVSGVGPRYDDLEAVAQRIRGTGWNLELIAPQSIAALAAMRPRLARLGVPVVVPSLGRAVASRGIADPGFQDFVAMVRDGIVWTKLSHPYHMEEHQPYAAVMPFARTLVAANPKRCLFGLDWPHQGLQEHPPVPDDGFLLDLFAQWVPEEVLRKTILVDNPAELYRF